jgi:hypothetical protein
MWVSCVFYNRKVIGKQVFLTSPNTLEKIATGTKSMFQIKIGCFSPDFIVFSAQKRGFTR